MARGGRISSGASCCISCLGIKPIIHLVNGVLVRLGIVMSAVSSYDFILQHLATEIPDGKLVRVSHMMSLMLTLHISVTKTVSLQ